MAAATRSLLMTIPNRVIPYVPISHGDSHHPISPQVQWLAIFLRNVSQEFSGHPQK
jgi:hypothetical protein